MNLNTIPKSKADLYKPSLVILNDRGEILLVESKRKSGTFKSVGGRIEVGETILECMKRELLEEFGTDKFEVVRKIYSTGITQSIDEQITVEIDFFEARLENLNDLVFNKEENTSFAWFSVDKLTSGNIDISHQLLEMLKYL